MARPRIAGSIDELIGETPLIRLNRVTGDAGGEVLALPSGGLVGQERI